MEGHATQNDFPKLNKEGIQLGKLKLKQAMVSTSVQLEVIGMEFYFGNHF